MKILIATDGSAYGQHAVEKACDLAEGRDNVAFRVVSVHEALTPIAAEPWSISAEYYQRFDDLAKLRAEETVQKSIEYIKSRRPGESTDITSLVELGIPQQVIVEAAEEWKPDLVVVGSHGYGFWSRLALGSVSDAVAHHAPCSVLIVKSPEAAR